MKVSIRDLIETALKYSGMDKSVPLGNGIYAIYDCYNTKMVDDCQYESHKKYVDIQYMIEGYERIYIADATKLEISFPYSKEKDVVFYKYADADNIVTLIPEKYIMFTPKDAHMPGIMLNSSEKIHKIVLKVPIEIELVE